MDALLTRITELWQDAVEIWQSGGWAMIAIAVIAFVMFAVGMSIRVRLQGTGSLSVPERTWRRWIDHPAERRGPIGSLLDHVTAGRSVKETAALFHHLRMTETVPFERDLRVMKVCVSAAPLVGLLGTVTGMLVTFGALATGGGGEQTMGMVAGGISEALITTETGLVIALPGLFFQYRLARKHERYKAFLAHLETVCTQTFHRGASHQRKRQVQTAAREWIARELLRRLQQREVPHGTVS